MNYRGSYRRLLANSKSAIAAASELYDKPNVEYRDEIVVVLLMNGWELFLKAVVSRDGSSVYYKKRRNEPYRTLSMSDSFWRASNSALWPSTIRREAIDRNLEFLSTFRDNAIHFYNAAGASEQIKKLAPQTTNRSARTGRHRPDTTAMKRRVGGWLRTYVCKDGRRPAASRESHLRSRSRSMPMKNCSASGVPSLDSRRKVYDSSSPMCPHTEVTVLWLVAHRETAEHRFAGSYHPSAVCCSRDGRRSGRQ